jgi:hypothetical protein
LGGWIPSNLPFLPSNAGFGEACFIPGCFNFFDRMRNEISVKIITGKETERKLNGLFW